MAAIGASERQGSDRPLPDDSSEAQGSSAITKEEKPSSPESSKDLVSSNKDDTATPPIVLVNAPTISPRGESVTPLGFFDGRVTVNPQAHVYYGGYENSPASWDEHSQFLYSEGMEGTHSFIFHAGYGYSPQIPFGPYSPIATLNGPLVRRENQIYSYEPSLNGPYYPQPGPYYNSPLSSSPANPTSPAGPGPGLLSNGQYFHDSWQASDGFSPGGLWSDWLRSLDSPRPFSPLSPAISPHPIGQGFSPFSPTPFGSQGPSRNRPYNRRITVNTVDSGMCSCSGPVDFLNEQNRGPRVVKPEISGVDFDSYNKFDFKTDYDDARFFVIKSYSEDNVHKSIKYGVWASTPNGNRKLDAAYAESKVKGTECPVFLLFSVNASAHFCGVAEMVGPVDFEKSVDYWQQDKWTGHFPVKWHVVKDVPNSHFRHIVLENNDNKPVTNSRDTQEVKLEQGVEMLSIFKNHETRMSILDDFGFYEERERAMEERKSRERKRQEQEVGHLQKTFAQAVRLEEKMSSKEEADVSLKGG